MLQTALIEVNPQTVNCENWPQKIEMSQSSAAKHILNRFRVDNHYDRCHYD